MNRSLRFACVFAATAALAAVGAQGCGGASDSNLFDGDGGSGDDAAQGHDGTGGRDGATGDGASGDGATHDAAPCTGLECQVTRCDGGATTTITGTVTDPSKANPVYNAIVWIPNGQVPDVPAGPTCDLCGKPPGGRPIAVALTAADGTFTLSNVPVGTNVPLVVQIGKWRRAVQIPRVDACVDNPVDRDLTRLPKNKSEGHIPQIAIATGGCDQLECLLRKMGVDDAEFTAPAQNGRIHVYQGMSGGTVTGSPMATTLWSSATQLAKYDMVLNGCECQANVPPRESLQRMAEYTAGGGRWLATHYQYTWIANGPFPLPWTATFGPDGFGSDTLALTVNTTIPKGQAFAAWLVATGASTTAGTVQLDTMRHNVSATTPPSTPWLTGNDTSATPPQEVAFYTFNAPFPQGAVDAGAIDAGGDAGPWGDAGTGPACGKVGFADFHASLTNATPGAFPGECTTPAMSNDEKALEFLLFDLGGCIQDDTQAPKPPPLR